MAEEFVRTSLYHITDILGRINSPSDAQLVEKIRDRMVRPADHDEDEITTIEVESEASIRQTRPGSKLTPWREVIRPNTDVQQGTFEEAEFAADLQQVYDGRARSLSEYV